MYPACTGRNNEAVEAESWQEKVQGPLDAELPTLLQSRALQEAGPCGVEVLRCSVLQPPGHP